MNNARLQDQLNTYSNWYFIGSAAFVVLFFTSPWKVEAAICFAMLVIFGVAHLQISKWLNVVNEKLKPKAEIRKSLMKYWLLFCIGWMIFMGVILYTLLQSHVWVKVRDIPLFLTILAFLLVAQMTLFPIYELRREVKILYDK